MMMYSNQYLIYENVSCCKSSMVWPYGGRLDTILVVSKNAHIICTKCYVHHPVCANDDRVVEVVLLGY